MKIEHCEIRLEGLRFYAYHGVLEQERRVGGHYTLDVCLHLSDASAAIGDDALSGTVNYAEVYDVLREEMAQPSALLEHVVGRMLKALFERFDLIEAADVVLRKDNPPMGAACAGCAVALSARR